MAINVILTYELMVFQKFFLIYSLLFTSILIGQNKIELEVLVQTDSMNNPINVVNLTQQNGVSVLPFVKFNLLVQRNDTLLFSALNLQDEIVVIDLEIINDGKLDVFLKEKLNELGEVQIHHLSGNLARDIESIPVFDKYKLNAPMARKEPPTEIERRIYTATTGPGGTKLNFLTVLTGRIPVDPLLNKINGRTKKLEQLKELDENASLLKELKIKFPVSFFTAFLKIEKLEINLFLISCIENSDFPKKIESADQAGLIDFLKENADYFKNNYK